MVASLSAVKGWQLCACFVTSTRVWGAWGHRWPRNGRKHVRLFVTGIWPRLWFDAAVARLEADGAEALSLRELARDAGVNHRAVYRHFPDKLSLVAQVAEEGWRRMERRVRQQIAGKPAGEQMLVAAGVGFFLFARDNPNLFGLMAGPRVNLKGAFPGLEAAMAETMAMFCKPFIDSGLKPELALDPHGAVHVSAARHHTQILHGRLYVSRAKAREFRRKHLQNAVQRTALTRAQRDTFSAEGPG